MSPELKDLLHAAAAHPTTVDADDLHRRGVRRRAMRRGGMGAASVAVVLLAGSLLPGTGGTTAPTVVTPPGAGAPSPSPTTSPAAPVDTGPSQSVEDAERDGVLPEVAALSFEQRVEPYDGWGGAQRVETDEGVWVASKAPHREGQPHTLGDTDGIYGKDYVVLGEYGEVLLLDHDEARILQAWPLPGVYPQQLIVSDDAVHCAKQGDGGLPDSMLCRIDRSSGAMSVRILTASFDGGTWFDPPDNWTVEEAGDWPIGTLARAGDVLIAGDHVIRVVFDAATLDPVQPSRVETVYGHITDASTAGRTFDLDEAEWLSGEEARAEWEAETGETDGPPNDYVIRDDEASSRPFRLADDVHVAFTGLWDGPDVDGRRHDCCGTFEVAWTTLAGHFGTGAEDRFEDHQIATVRGLGYWVTTVDEVVVHIEQQYQP